MKTRHILSIFIIGLLSLNTHAQIQTVTLEVNPTANMAQAVNGLFSGCTSVSNIVVSGNQLSNGTFSNGSSVIGIEEGIILSTGKVTDAATPNFSGSTNFTFWTPGDPVYNAYFGNNASYDAASITFDVVAHSEVLSLEYVFASEGYEFDFTNQGWPEGVGIFVSGANPLNATPYANQNIALVPNSSTPVCIDSINSNLNSMFYNQANFGSYGFQYDGYTDVMTARILTVPCSTYTVKIVVADFNRDFDSAVFIAANSIKSDFRFNVEYQHTAGSQGELYEGCTGNIVISRLDQLDTVPIPINVAMSGVAIEAVDYTGLSSGQILMGAQNAFLTIPVTAIIDNIVEGSEEWTITFSHPSICDPNCTASETITIDIIDNFELEAGIVEDDMDICTYNTNFVNLHTFIPPDMDPFTVTYQWNVANATTANISVDPPVGNCFTYKVTISDVCGQTAIDSVRICNSSFVNLNVSTQHNLCYGDTNGIVNVVPVGGFESFHYEWLPEELGDSTAGLITGLGAGTYQVTVTDSIGCFREHTFTITQPDSIYYSLTAYDPLCHNDTNGSILLQTFNGVPPFTFEWSNGETSSSLSDLGGGFYAVTATDQNYCTIKDSVTLINPAPLWLNVSNDMTVCKNAPTQLTAFASGGTPAYFFFWSNGASGPQITVSLSENTIYDVYVKDLNGCTSEQREIAVSVYPDIHVELITINDSICKGDSSVLHADIIGGTGGPYYVEFFDGASTQQLPPPYTVTPELSTTYEINVQDFCNLPPATHSFTVEVFDAPDVEIIASNLQGCQPLTVTFNETAAPDGSKYDWDFGDGNFSLLSSLKSPKYTFENDGFYDISLEVTSPVGCKTLLTNENFIEVFKNPTARFYPSASVVSELKPIVLFTNTSTDAYISEWDFGDGSPISYSHNPEHYFDAPGEYIIRLETESKDGCRDAYSQKIKVEQEYNLFIPSAINPHSSIAENRIFRPKGQGVDLNNYQLAIYDRWGNKVFETFDFYRGWDGLVGGEYRPGITYNYIIRYQDLKGESFTQTGTVTVTN